MFGVLFGDRRDRGGRVGGGGAMPKSLPNFMQSAEAMIPAHRT